MGSRKEAKFIVDCLITDTMWISHYGWMKITIDRFHSVAFLLRQNIENLTQFLIQSLLGKGRWFFKASTKRG